MRPQYFDMDPPDVDRDGIAEAQQIAGAGNLVLDGALADLGTAAQFDIGDNYSAGIGGVRIGIFSAGNLSGVTFTVTGKDQDGVAITEEVTGPNNSTTETTNYFSQVTQIAADGAVASDVEVGPVDEPIGKTYPINWRANEAFTVTLEGISGTLDVTIQESFSDPESGSRNMVWQDAQANKSANLSALLTLHARAVRLVWNSYSSGAELQFGIIGN